MSAVYQLTLRQLTGRWRLIIMAVLSLGPVLFTAFVLNQQYTPSVVEFESIVLSTMLAGSIAPLIIVALAAVAFSNEIEDRTLANLTLAPLPRWRIVVPKLLASVTIAGPFILISTFLTCFIAFNRDMLATWSVTLGALAGLLLYASMFTWLGLVTKAGHWRRTPVHRALGGVLLGIRIGDSPPECAPLRGCPGARTGSSKVRGVRPREPHLGAGHLGRGLRALRLPFGTTAQNDGRPLVDCNRCTVAFDGRSLPRVLRRNSLP